MEIEYEIDDGYVGHRPHGTRVDDDEILECDTVDEAMELIEDAIQEDFMQNISPRWDNNDLRKRVEVMFADKPKDEED